MAQPDHVAITNLVLRYAELIDAGDYEGIGAHFGDAVITADGTDHETRGAAAITAMYHASTRLYENGTPLTKHVTTNLLIEVADDGATATCRSYYTVFQKTAAAPLQPIIAGRYHDQFAQRDEHWRFTRRHMIVDLIGDLSRHLLFSLEG